MFQPSEKGYILNSHAIFVISEYENLSTLEVVRTNSDKCIRISNMITALINIIVNLYVLGKIYTKHCYFNPASDRYLEGGGGGYVQFSMIYEDISGIFHSLGLLGSVF